MKFWPARILTLFCLCSPCASLPTFAQQNYFSGWSSYVGSDYDSDTVLAVAADSQTNTYFGGYLGAWSSSILNNDDNVSANGSGFFSGSGLQEGFVAKTDRDGHLLWYTLVCDADDDQINGVAVHTNGTVYAAGVMGRYEGLSDSDTGTEASLIAVSGASGDPAWKLPIGSRNGTNGFNAVVVDSNGYVYAAGYTTETNLPGALAGSAYKGKTDAFVVKVSPANSVIWSRYFGGTNAESATALALAPDGSVYVGGQTRTPGWTSVPTATTGPTTPDGFVAKLNANGALVWSVCLGGSASNAVTALAKDPASAALYVGGATTATNFLSGATRPVPHAGGADGFVVRLADLGVSFQTNWCRFFGGTSADRVSSLSLHPGDGLAVGGATASGGWLTQTGTNAFSGVQDGFVSLLGNDGAVSWSVYVGDAKRDDVSGLAVRGDKLVAAGTTFSPGWISGGFWPSWSKDPDYDGVPNDDADLSFGYLATWTAEPGVPPAVTAQPASLTVGEGASATFAVTATGTSPLSYRWFRNNAPLVGATNAAYTLAAAAVTNNADVYFCVVSNFYGSAVSSNATLTVIANGVLTVTLAPAQAVSQGAKWRLNGSGPWLSGGASTNLPPGAYAVSFTNLTGWLAPAALAGVQVASGATTATAGVYTAILPSAARAIAGTNVTVTVRAPAGLSTWTLVETLPAGATPANVSAGGVWNSGASTLTFTGAEATTNTCSYSVFCATSGLYTVNGTVTPQPAGIAVAVTGDSQILKASFIRTISGTAVTIRVTQTSNIWWFASEKIPTNITPVNITGPSAYWDDVAREISWALRGPGVTLTYEVTGEPGAYLLSGKGQITGQPEEDIFGDSVLTIAGAEPVPAPDILAFVPVAGAGYGLLSFTSVLNQAYAILTNSTLGDTNAWSVCLPVMGAAGTTQSQVPMTAPQLFYRVRVQ